MTTVDVTRHSEMERQWREFDSAHPEIWNLFKKFTFQKLRQGFNHYGARDILHRIRWETDKAQEVDDHSFKINNNLSPFYSRRFMEQYPQHDGFFRTRFQISRLGPATGLPPLGPKDFDGGES